MEVTLWDRQYKQQESLFSKDSPFWALTVPPRMPSKVPPLSLQEGGGPCQVPRPSVKGSRGQWRKRREIRGKRPQADWEGKGGSLLHHLVDIVFICKYVLLRFPL